jgi:hypothetical protein
MNELSHPISPISPVPLNKQKISSSLKSLHEKIDLLLNETNKIQRNENERMIVNEKTNENTKDTMELRAQLIENNAAHNLYSSTKSIGQQFLNISVITNYIQIIVNIFSLPVALIGRFDIALIVLISISMINQGFIFIIVTVLYKATNDRISQNCTATMLNNLVTTLTAITVILNIPITVLISTKNSFNNTTNTQ